MMSYRVALAVFAVMFAGVGIAAAQAAAPDLGGHWIMTTTVTNGNTVDQARIGHDVDLYCTQSALAMTCHSQDGMIFLRGGLNGAAVRMSGAWRAEEVQMALNGTLVNSHQMHGTFNADMTVGLGVYEASGEWKATKVAY